MLRTWRLTRAQYVATALSGEGSARYPGRWNVRGSRVTYLSEHLSLAMLEILAHAESLETLSQYLAIEVSLPETSIATIDKLPKDWQKNPAPDSTRQLGHQWFVKAETLILKVPSVLVANEYNYLINPNHEAYADIKVARPIALPFDARVLRLASE